MLSHYLNQCWLIVNWAPGNKCQWNSNKNFIICHQEKCILKCHLPKWWPFCPGGDELIPTGNLLSDTPLTDSFTCHYNEHGNYTANSLTKYVLSVWHTSNFKGKMTMLLKGKLNFCWLLLLPVNSLLLWTQSQAQPLKTDVIMNTFWATDYQNLTSLLIH